MKRKLPLLIFLAGFLIGLVTITAIIWADFEASLFDVSKLADEQLNGLRCPLFMTTGETGEVSAAFENDHERPLQITTRAHFTLGTVTLMEEFNSRESFEAGEKRWLSWPITKENVVFDRLILARISTLRSAVGPPRQSSCGIVVFDWPFLRGWQITTLALLLSFGGMGGGVYLHYRQCKRSGKKWQGTMGYFLMLIVIISLGIAAGVMGWWLSGIILLLFTFLLVVLANLDWLAGG